MKGCRVQLMIFLSREPDDREAARMIQREAVRPLLEKFYPLYKKSGGTQGFVSIQGDPLAETDPDMIIKEAIEDRKMGGQYYRQDSRDGSGA